MKLTHYNTNGNIDANLFYIKTAFNQLCASLTVQEVYNEVIMCKKKRKIYLRMSRL